MNHATPEQKGISSRQILGYLKKLEENRLSMHSLILMRGEDIFFEKYWEPFHREYLHRMYSVTKSFVALAIGFLEQDGLISLDDPIIKYFPKESENLENKFVRMQTIRHMLKMSTARGVPSWFVNKPQDRVQYYFENHDVMSRSPGTTFSYDSCGSFIMGALVERVTGKRLIAYLREKLFDKIGVSKEAYCLKCPGGHSWGDSALICRTEDLLKTARFVMNGGSWNGEQILNREYVTTATSNLVANNFWGTDDYNTYGYGYQFWRTRDNSYCFNGMGSQFAICVPDRDLILACNADNQGKEHAGSIIIDGFFDMIARQMSDTALPEDAQAQQELADYAAGLKLAVAQGGMTSPWQDKVNGVTYAMEKNPMGITKVRFDFDEKAGTGRMVYTNAQGEKELAFGMGENVFGIFPEVGYSAEVGGIPTESHQYKCANSAAWMSPYQLFVKVQIIDEYFGNLNISVGFEDDRIGIIMVKCAEDFLQEYEGFAGGIACK